VTRATLLLVRAVACVLALAPALAGCGAIGRVTGGGTARAADAPQAEARRAAGAAQASASRAQAPVVSADALAEARSRATLEPAEPYWPYREAELVLAARGAGAAEAAARSLEASLARDPGYTPALALRSRLDFAAGRHLEAIARLEPYRVSLPGVSEDERRTLLEGLALHYDAIGRVDLAAETLRQLGPGSGDSPASLRVYLDLRGETPDRADEAAARALKQGPETAVNRNNFGITRLRAGDVEGARASFERAIELDPALPGPYYNLALLEKHYRFDERAAAKWLALYRERSNDDPDGLFGQGRE
jgi:Tfp pilus assembly protein PilF